MHLVDQPRFKILPDRRRSAADPNIEVARRFLCPLQCRVNSVGNKVKRSSALHFNRVTGMVSKDKCRHVIWRLVSPPAFPVIVGPRAPDRAEHVSAHYPRTLALHRLRRKSVIDAGFSALAA